MESVYSSARSLNSDQPILLNNFQMRATEKRLRRRENEVIVSDKNKIYIHNIEKKERETTVAWYFPHFPYSLVPNEWPQTKELC